MTLKLDCAPSEEALSLAVQLRHRVFVIEQGVDQAIEQDGRDHQAHHVVVSDASGEVVGTGRLMLGDGYAKVQRVAVKASRRGQGVGKKVMEGLDQVALSLGIKEMRLSSQADAVPFYTRLGYRTQGEPYLEAGIVHLAMSRLL